jgi:GNAT superfamily N-acetyltransferase
VVEIVAAGEMAVARVEGKVVGSVRIRQPDPNTGFFGLLAVSPDQQGEGVGRALVLFAEDLSRERGARSMELRLLVPRGQRDPGKDKLDAWYSRLGYVSVGNEDFSASHPDITSRVPLDILTYRKRL